MDAFVASPRYDQTPSDDHHIGCDAVVRIKKVRCARCRTSPSWGADGTSSRTRYSWKSDTDDDPSRKALGRERTVDWDALAKKANLKATKRKRRGLPTRC
jgi:hypothetical protein